MTHAIRVHRPGGPEVLRWESIGVGAPAPGEVRVRHTAIGLNFIDVYHRTGLYPQPLPLIPGVEGAGIITAVGTGVTGLKVGDRVAYVLQIGAYAEERLISADRVVNIPDGVSNATAAASLLKGLTARFLIRRTYEVQPGDTILIHAAAGGVGLILCQWAKALGASVIGTVSTAEKAELCRAHGCDHPIITRNSDFVDAVKELTAGQGVPVVYDSVGRETFGKSLECLRPYGLMVLFGQSSGAVPPLDPNILQRGSLYLTRPTLATYAASRKDLVEGADELFSLIGAGAIQISVNHRFALRDARVAHERLEARQTTGSTILIP
jgi:NADPH2:quinone reductase